MTEKLTVVRDVDKKKRVLICEHNLDMAKLLQFMLAYEGLIADIAISAVQAKQMLAQHDYSAMTLDLGLPDLNGISFIRELRAAKETADLPIIVISADADKKRQTLQGQAFNVVDWINNKVMGHDQFAAALKRAVVQAHAKRARVLHVEDDLDIYQVAQVIVGEFADIENAPTLAVARQMLKSQQYDLIILDIVMPDGSGLELLPELNSATPPIPVLVLSAHEVSKEVVRQVGAALMKSRTDNVQLLATIKRMVGVE